MKKFRITVTIENLSDVDRYGVSGKIVTTINESSATLSRNEKVSREFVHDLSDHSQELLGAHVVSIKTIIV